MRRLAVTTMVLLCLVAMPVWSQGDPDGSDSEWASESDDIDAAGDYESGDIDGDWSGEDAVTSEDEYAGEEATDDESAGEHAAPEDENEPADGADEAGGDDAAPAEEEESADEGDAESDPAAEEQPEGDAGVDGSNTDEAGSGDPVSAMPEPQPSPATSSALPTPIGRHHFANGEFQALPTQIEIEEARDRYFVVQNQEEQYSIWAEGRDLPLGWNAIGLARSKQEALDYIKEQWTDRRPQSLRRQMEAMEREAAARPDGGKPGG